MSKRRHPSKISKAQGYIHRLFAVEYDLDGMVKAYGIDFVCELARAIAAGKIDCRQAVQRWSADRAMYGADINAFTWFSTHSHEFLLSEDECLALFEETK